MPSPVYNQPLSNRKLWREQPETVLPVLSVGRRQVQIDRPDIAPHLHISSLGLLLGAAIHRSSPADLWPAPANGHSATSQVLGFGATSGPVPWISSSAPSSRACRGEMSGGGKSQ